MANISFSIPRFIQETTNGFTQTVQPAIDESIDRFLWLGCPRNYIAPEVLDGRRVLPLTWSECREQAAQDMGRFKTCTLAARYFFFCKCLHPLLEKQVNQIGIALNCFVNDEVRFPLILDNLMEHLAKIPEIYNQQSQGYYDLTVQQENQIRGHLADAFRVLLTEIIVIENSSGQRIPVGSLGKEELILKILQSIKDNFISELKLTVPIPKIDKTVSITASRMFKIAALCSLIYFQFYISIAIFIVAKLLPEKIIQQYFLVPLVRCILFPISHLTSFLGSLFLGISSSEELFDKIGKMILAFLRYGSDNSDRFHRDIVFAYLPPILTADVLAAHRLQRRCEGFIPPIVRNSESAVRWTARPVLSYLPSSWRSEYLDRYLREGLMRGPIHALIARPVIGADGMQYQLKIEMRKAIAARLSEKYSQELQMDKREKNICAERQARVKENLQKLLELCQENRRKLEQSQFDLRKVLDIDWGDPLGGNSSESLRLQNIDQQIRRRILEDSKGLEYALFANALNVFCQNPSPVALLKLREISLGKRPPLPSSFFGKKLLGNDNHVNKLDVRLKDNESDIQQQEAVSLIELALPGYRTSCLQYLDALEKTVNTGLAEIEKFQFVPLFDRVDSSSTFQGVTEQFVADATQYFIMPSLFSGSLGRRPALESIRQLDADTLGDRVAQIAQQPIDRWDVLMDLVFKHTPRKLVVEFFIKLIAQQWLTAFPTRT